LAEFKNSNELVAWLQKQPREVAVALAARGALRVLPFVQEALRYGRANYVILPIYRALAFAWTTATYSLPTKGYAAPPIDLGQFGLASKAATYAGGAAQAARVVVSNPALARGAFDFAEDAFRSAANSAAGIAFWPAVSTDATRLEQGKTASVIAGSPLWPNGPPLWQPDPLWSLWQDMKEALHATNEDWQVWTIWYDDRLEGRVRNEERELAYVRIEEDLWDQGPAIVNAEIKRRSLSQTVASFEVTRIEGLERPNPVVGPTSPITADIEPPAYLQLADGASIHTQFTGRFQPTVLPAVSPQFMGPGDASMRPHGSAGDTPLPLRTEQQPPAPPLEAIPEQAPTATNFRINSEGLIDVVPDPPTPETLSDALQRELYNEVRGKAQALAELGGNLLGDLVDPATRFRDCLPERIEDLSIVPSWSRGNTLRSRLKAHDLSTSNGEPDLARLPPLVGETLRDLVHTWNIFIVGDPKGRELDEIRLGPQEIEVAKQVLAAAGPIVEAIESSENVATASAKDVVVEQAQAARTAPAGIDGDQAIDLSRKTMGNFVAELLRSVYVAVRRESGFAWKEYRAGIYRAAGTATAAGIGYAAYNNWPAITSFIAENADPLKSFVTAAWHNPTLIEIIDWIVRMAR
jgi:hypothetical protein